MEVTYSEENFAKQSLQSCMIKGILDFCLLRLLPWQTFKAFELKT